MAKDNLGWLKKTLLDGPADLVVEITSSESYLRDRSEKFAEYELGIAYMTRINCLLTADSLVGLLALPTLLFVS